MIETTYYIRDAQGNVMATYLNKNEGSAETYHLTERPIYGSSRLGMLREKVNMLSSLPEADAMRYMRYGLKNYELTNHLGNVTTILTAQKVPFYENTFLTYKPQIVQSMDYSPFGVTRLSYDVTPVDVDNPVDEGYRYGFNGMEKDDEVKGSGNHYTATFWEMDPRLGKRWNMDPVVKFHESPYATFANNPIWFTDPTGADSTLYFNSSGEQIGQSFDGLENSIVSIPDQNLEEFNRMRSNAADVNSDELNAELRKYGVGYDIDGFKEFFNCNLCDINRDWSDGSGSLYVNEHKTFLYQSNGMIRVGQENFQGDPIDMYKSQHAKPLFPSLSVGDLHTHPNAGLSRGYAQVFTHRPSTPDYITNSKPFFDIVVSDKLIYFINNNSSEKFAVNFNKTFTTLPENPFEQ